MTTSAPSSIFNYNPKIVNSLIDTFVFAAANYGAHSLIKIKSPEMHHIIIFAAADWLTRNGFILGKSYVGSPGRLNEDIYITVAYVVVSSVFDLFIDKDTFRKGILDNIFRGAIGLGGNVLVDNFIVKGSLA
jgi:hypothetical protein